MTKPTTWHARLANTQTSLGIRPVRPEPSPHAQLMQNTLVFFTFLDVRVRLSISDLRLSSDRRTILIGRGPHLAMIPSHREVSIRMNIIFTPMNQLKQLSQYEWFVSRTETPYRKCRKIWTRFSSSEMRKRVVQIWELRDLKPVPLQKAAQTGNFTLVNPKVSLCSARRGEPSSI